MATGTAEALQSRGNVIPLVGGLKKKRHDIYQIPVTEGELWTARQRQMNPLHYSVSYRASFKPELPDFFIRRYLQAQGQGSGRVMDPFGGRGTTTLQANLMGYGAIHNDLNPVSIFISKARSHISDLSVLGARLDSLPLEKGPVDVQKEDVERLTPFFHPRTLEEILRFKEILLSPEGMDDPDIRYLGLTALSRLHGHSDGFFSVYTFPQISIMPGAQKRNNQRRGEVPVYKGIRDRIQKKMKKDLSGKIPEYFHKSSRNNLFTRSDSRELEGVRTSSVDLIVTSPPFLDKVDYLGDNWMRAWFLGVEDEVKDLPLGIFSSTVEWSNFMRQSMEEMGRVLKAGARAVIEVGEVKVGKGITNLEELLLEHLPMKVRGGVLEAEELFINRQEFTKLANCWDVKNNAKGTNTNRCLVLRKRKV